MTQVSVQRERLISKLFPQGFPRLWCPLIVHYDEAKQADPERTRKHLLRLHPHVRSFLIFGSTGDGWTLSLTEKTTLLTRYIELARELDLQLLVGVLQHRTADVATEMAYWLQQFAAISQKTDALAAMQACRIVGFTVCPPQGADLSQETIRQDLESILSKDLPIALYQLPQVTQNEISPETLQQLAERWPNFFMFKDTSGRDKVLLSGLDYTGVRLVRGMEGSYSRWYRPGQMSYDGFLLSSANCFAAELDQLIQLTDMGQEHAAVQLCERVSAIIDTVFADVAGLGSGNPFANANKCLDHILAYGNHWAERSAPILHAGERIPKQHLSFARQALIEYGWSVATGYLTSTD